MKSELRARYRDERTVLERPRRQQWTAELNRHLLAASQLTGARWVGAYLAFDGEPDVRFTLTQLARRGVGVALPVLPDESHTGLQFHRWTPATALTANRHGISEPKATAAVKPSELGVLLIPLVAWDRTGNRLGMGGGWYDRTLAQADVTALRVGVAWSFQEADALPREAWDQPLDAVVTETGWLSFSENATPLPAAGEPATGL